MGLLFANRNQNISASRIAWFISKLMGKKCRCRIRRQCPSIMRQCRSTISGPMCTGHWATLAAVEKIVCSRPQLPCRPFHTGSRKRDGQLTCSTGGFPPSNEVKAKYDGTESSTRGPCRRARLTEGHILPNAHQVPFRRQIIRPEWACRYRNGIAATTNSSRG